MNEPLREPSHDNARPRESTASRLLARLAADQASRRLPSVIAGLVREGRLVWWGARGRVGDDAPDLDVQYRIGSISKTFTAIAVMRLRDEGLLRLADPVERHLPETPVSGATVAQLLSHSAGLSSETAGPWWERTPGGDFADLAARSAGESGQRHRPGRMFHYSNVGYGVLGELVGRLRGASWSEVVAREILAPLEMRRTSERPSGRAAPGLAVHPWADVVLPEPEHHHGAMAPAGQLWSTLADQARLAAFLAGDTGGVLSADTLAEMREPAVVNDTREQPWASAYGLGLQLWNEGGRRSHGHTGSVPGFVSVVRVDGGGPGDDGAAGLGDGVIVLTNSTSGFSPTLGGDLMRLLREAEPRPAAEWTPSAVAPEVLEIVGPWYWGPNPFHVRARAGGWLKLTPMDGQGRGSRFRPTEQLRGGRRGEPGDHGGEPGWVGLDGYYAGEPLRVVRRPDGSVDHLDLGSFVFTRAPYDPQAQVPGGVDDAGWRP